ncbi:hypothetical protein CEP53_001941 [Fusarium sp. AF-6]|nr:hypothetical protein CEP53_001941 [Fusarium sp. AF-6]
MKRWWLETTTLDHPDTHHHDRSRPHHLLGSEGQSWPCGPSDEDIRELIFLNHLTRCRSPDATTALKVQLLSSDSTEESIQAFRVHTWHSLSPTLYNPIFR